MTRHRQESTLRRILLQAATIAGFAMLALTPARAEISDVEILFIKADTDGDLVLSKAEYLIIAVTQFGITDSNRNNLLEKKEIGELSGDKEFTDNDGDKDGALSIEEVLKEKLADFSAADTNQDGRLSLGEVKAQYGSQQ